MKITKSNTKSLTPILTLADVPNGEPVDYGGTTVIKLGVSGKFLNSHMVSDILARDAYFVMVLTTGAMTTLDGTKEVTRLDYTLTINGKKG
jgi:hypothetical protein